MRYLFIVPFLLLLAGCSKPEMNEQDAAVYDSPNNMGLDSAYRENNELDRIGNVVTH